MGKTIFGYTQNISELTIPAGISTGEEAFAYTTGLRRVTFEEGCTEIPYGFFSHCENLESIVFPSTLTTICESAFGNCLGLIRIEIPDTVTTICTGAFEYCNNLEEIILGAGLQSIGFNTRGGANRPVFSLHSEYHIPSPDVVWYRNLTLIFKGTSPPQDIADSAFSFGTQVTHLPSVDIHGNPVEEGFTETIYANVSVISPNNWAGNLPLSDYTGQYDTNWTRFTYVGDILVSFIEYDEQHPYMVMRADLDGYLSEYPPDPAGIQGQSFDGWFLTPQDPDIIPIPFDLSHQFTQDSYVYAHWKGYAAYTMIFVLSPGSILNPDNATSIDQYFRVDDDNGNEIGTITEHEGAYIWSYASTELSILVKVKTPADNQLTYPPGIAPLLYTDDNTPRWSSSAPYTPITTTYETMTLSRAGEDRTYFRVFYPSWLPIREDDKPRAVLCAPGFLPLDVSEIQSVSKSYRASNTVIPIVCFGYRRSYVMDLGTTASVSIKYVRVEPANPTPATQTGDSRLWSNADWLQYLRDMVNRWQLRTNGQKLYLLNPAQSSERAQPASMMEMICTNCYIADAPVSYSDLGSHAISGSLELYLGTLYPMRETPAMIAVTYSIGGEYADKWSGAIPKEISYPADGIIRLPEYDPWQTSIIEYDPSTLLPTKVYFFQGWNVITEDYPQGAIYAPGEVVFVRDLTSYSIEALSVCVNIDATNSLLVSGNDINATQTSSIYGSFTVSISQGQSHAEVNAILAGGGGGGAGAKKVHSLVTTSTGFLPVSHHSYLYTAGGGGGSGDVSENVGPNSWHIYEDTTYYFTLGHGGVGGTGVKYNGSAAGGNGAPSTFYTAERQLAYASGGAGASDAYDTGNSTFMSAGGQGYHAGGSSGTAAYHLINDGYAFDGDTSGGNNGGGSVAYGRATSDARNIGGYVTSDNRVFSSGAGGGAGADNIGMFASDTIFQAGDGGYVGKTTNDTIGGINGATATHSRGGGGGGCSLNVSSTFPQETPGNGGAGGRGYILVYVVGGTITNATWS